MKVRIFDFDGVLVDSLDAHIKFYQDFAAGLRRKKLSREELIKAISGEKMDFYRAMGFKEHEWQILNEAYKDRFSQYNCPVFPGVPEMLKELGEKGMVLGIATFNLRKHVERFFLDYLSYFDSIMTRDDGNKVAGIRRIKEKYGNVDYLFIGDTLWDVKDAKEAGVKFLGASYGGWQKFNNESFRVARRVRELRDLLSC